MKLPVPVDTAVLLAAGRGKRLSPWTDRTPKPLLVHRGRPTLDRVLDALEKAGVQRVILVTHHLSDQIKSYSIRRRAVSNQELVCLRQENLFGTAHALECVMVARPEFLVTPFLLSATDYIVPPTFYRDLLTFHASHDAQMSISLKALEADGAAARSSVRFAAPESESLPDAGLGSDANAPPALRSWHAETEAAAQAATRTPRLLLDSLTGDARDARVIGALDILEVVEKPAPDTAPSAIAANLCFVLPPELLGHIGAVAMSTRGEREIQAAINAWLANGGRARGLVAPAPAEWEPPA